MALAKKTFTGVARQTAIGTAITAPVHFTPVKSKFQNKTKYVYVDEDRNTRDVNNDRVGTIRYASGSLDGSVYLSGFGYLLLSFMGAVVSTQPDATNAPTAYQHAFTLADQGVPLTLFKGYDQVRQHAWADTVVEKIKLKFAADGKLLEHSTSVQGQFKVNSASIATPSYTSAYKPLAGYTPAIKLNNVASTDIESMEIDLEQKITLFYASAGSRSFVNIYWGDRKASVKFDARFDTDTLYESAFANETDQSVDVTFTGLSRGGTINDKLNLNFPIVGIDDADLTPTKDYWGVKFSGTARPGASVNSLFTATLINTYTSYAS